MSEQHATLAGLRVCVIAPFASPPSNAGRQPGLLCRFLEREGAQVQRIDSDARPRGPGWWATLIDQGMTLLGRLAPAVDRCDVVHVQATGDETCLAPLFLALLLGRLTGARAVASCLGGDVGGLLRRRERLIRPLLRRLTGLAVSSPRLQETWRGYGIETRVVPSIADTERFPFRLREVWPPRLLWAGALRPDAHPGMALRALAALRRSTPQARLLMVGRGSLAEQVNALAGELKVAEAVSYRPWLPFHRWRQALQAAGVLWCTAAADTPPTSLLQGIASGVVVVSARVPGVAGLLQDGVDGLLVAPYDHEALAAATTQVLRRPALAAGLADNARLALERHRWANVRREIAALYGLLDDDSAPPQPPGAGRSAGQEAAARAPGQNEQATVEIEGRTEFLQARPGQAGRSAAETNPEAT